MITSVSQAQSRRRPSLIIADDDPVVISMLAGGLRERFALVGFAADADEAIALAEAQQPEAAIVDVEMPGGGGLRATLEIRARSPQTAIVILSADEHRAGVIRLLNAGAVCYVRKGAAADVLAATISDSIDAHARACAS
jgi:DNA-binding NarL/FixJ family response regulator